MKQDSFHSGVVWTLLSAFGLSLTSLFGKLGFEYFTLSALIFWRFLAAFAFCLLVSAFLGSLKNKPNISHFKLNFFRAFFTLGAQASFYYYIKTHTLLNGMVLLNTGPIFIALIDWGILRRRVGKSSWIGVLVSFVGVLCILQPDAEIFTVTSLIGLLSGLCQGISQILFGLSSREENPSSGVLILFFFCAAISSFFYLFTGATWEAGKGLNNWALLLILLLGLGSTLNQLARSAAYQRSTPSRLSPFLYFAVPFAGLFDWLIFGSLPNLLSLLGTILVISGGLLKIYLRKWILQKK